MYEDMMDFIQQPQQKALIMQSDSIDDLKKSLEGFQDKTWGRAFLYYIEKYTAFEAAYRTIKENPITYHIKHLWYPEETKLSDFIKEIRYIKMEGHDPRPKDPAYIRQSLTWRNVTSESRHGDVLCNDKASALKVDRDGPRKGTFVAAYAFVKDEDKFDYEHSRGFSIELIDRQEGLIMIAKPSDYIGSRWMTIIKEIDVPIYWEDGTLLNPDYKKG